MGWCKLVVIELSIEAWGVGRVVLSKVFLKDLVKPEIFWVHAGFTTVAVIGIHREELLQWKDTGIAAVHGGLCFTVLKCGVVEEQTVLLWLWIIELLGSDS